MDAGLLHKHTSTNTSSSSRPPGIQEAGRPGHGANRLLPSVPNSSEHPQRQGSISFLSHCEIAETGSWSSPGLPESRRLDSEKNPQNLTRHVCAVGPKYLTKGEFSVKVITHLCALGSSTMLSLHSMRIGEQIVFIDSNRQVALLSIATPGTLIPSMLVFGVSTSIMYHLRHHQDKFQDTILAMGVSLALFYGILVDDCGFSVILGVFPWTVLVALFVSIIGHWLWRLRSATAVMI